MAMTTAKTMCCATQAPSCCGAPTDAFVRVSKLNTLTFNVAACINCGMCSVVCPHGVFARGGHGERAVQIVRGDACMECGACALNCPVGALQVDSGVGCAAAMISAALRGLDEPTCGCGNGESCC